MLASGRSYDELSGRAWIFLSGLPLGALGALAVRAESTLRVVSAASLVTGVLLVAVTEVLSRRGGPRAPGTRRMAAAASSAWLALPALALAYLDLAPGPRPLFGGVLLVVVLVLARASGRSDSMPSPGSWIRDAVTLLVLGSAGLVTLSALVAVLGAQVPPITSERETLIYDIDARVVTRPLPRCSTQPRAVEVLLDRGAHPRLGPDGRQLWFDAADPDGRRQVFRLELDSGRAVCWSCPEPGNNYRPHPGSSGLAVAFTSDRHATWRHPFNTEIHLASARGERPRTASRRLTHFSGSDDHAILGPTARYLAWSRRQHGRYDVVAAGFATGHGGLVLGSPGVLASGGAAWIAPLAWSVDGRSLVLAMGNPFGTLRAFALDPATGGRIRLGHDVDGGASFNADGAWLALATSRPAGWAARIPDAFGFLLGPWALRPDATAPRLAGTGVRVGEVREGAPQPLSLGALAQWGAPAGVALDPGAGAFVLAQRRVADGRVEERLVRVTLDCEAAPGDADGADHAADGA